MKRTSEMCDLFIPSGITDHLWTMVDLYKTDNCVFFLRPLKMGEAAVQDIRIDLDGFSFHHTVLGFRPVSFTVGVRRDGEDLVMSVLPSDRTRREIGKWEKVRATLAHRKNKTSEAPGSVTLPKAC